MTVQGPGSLGSLPAPGGGGAPREDGTRVERGSLVWLEYDLFLDSGQQIASSAASGPLRLRVGEWGGACVGSDKG